MARFRMKHYVGMSVLLIVLGMLGQGQSQRCTTLADIYIVLTASDTMVELPVLMTGARNGLRNLFTRTTSNRQTGPQISVCGYGTTAEEQIFPGQQLLRTINNIQMVGGISHLDLGIECARISSQANRRPGVPQYMVLIVSEDPLGFNNVDFTADAEEQIRLARGEGFVRITLTTLSDNVYPELMTQLADLDYMLHIDTDYTEFERRTNQGSGLPAVDPSLWRQFCPEEIITTTTTTTTTTPRPRYGLCSDCVIKEGIGYSFFEGDCRKFVQCFFDGRDPPYSITWTSPGTLWDKTQVEQRWPNHVICEWDTCTTQGTGFSAYGDERYCAAYWQCADIGGVWRTEKFLCCPDPLNQVWDDNAKECKAITNGPGCEDPCPLVRPTPDPLCNHDVRADPRHYFDIRDPNAGDWSCGMGMVFDTEKCTCIGTPVKPVICPPLFHVDFDGGVIKDKSRNRFWIKVNGTVTAKRDNQNSEWYGRFDGNSELVVPGLSNMDLMRDWALVVRYDAENNQNQQAALIGSTNCLKKQGSYQMALNPQNGQLEAFVKTKSNGNDRQDTATINVPKSGLNKAVYIYHNASGLEISVGGVSSRADIDGTMWRDDSLCGFHVGWGQGMQYFEGRIYEVIAYRYPDCVPDVF